MTIVDAGGSPVDTVTGTISNGAWSASVSAVQATALVDGRGTITASGSDIAGNPAQATRTLRIDQTAPSLTIATIAGDDTLNLAEATAGLTIGGTATGAEDGQIVSVSLVDAYGTAVDTVAGIVANSAWSASLGSAQATALVDDVYRVEADVSDAAGNPAVQVSRSLTVDQTPPTIGIDTIAGDDTLNLAGVTTGLLVSGTAPGAEDGQLVTVTIVDGGGTTVDTVTGVVSGGAWSASLGSPQSRALADGSYTVKAEVADVAGNLAAPATRSLTVDETIPTLTIGTIAGDDVLNLAEATDGVTINGSAPGAENGQVVTVDITNSGGTIVDTITGTVTDAAWSGNLTAGQATALVDGLYTVTANVSDVAGNTAVQAVRSLLVDQAPPTISIGTIAGDNVLNLAEATAGVTSGAPRQAPRMVRSSPSPWSMAEAHLSTPSPASSRPMPGPPASALSRRRRSPMASIPPGQTCRTPPATRPRK